MKDLVGIGEAVRELMAKPMKARVAFKLAVSTKPVRELYNEFDSQKGKIAHKYGTVDPSGRVTVPADRANEYVAEIEELLEVEVDAPSFTIKLDDIADLDVHAAHIAVLAPYIVEG